MEARRSKLLVVEDDPGLQRQLKWALDSFDVICVGNREDALTAMRKHAPSIVLQDLGLPPDADGVEEGFRSIAEIQSIAPQTKIVVITGREGREHALRAVSMGAFDFCQKPVDTPMLALVVGRAQRIHELESEVQRLSEEAKPLTAVEGVVAASASMMKACRLIERLAPTDATVLLLGESGTGKERLARALHMLSPRANKPMVAINCAAIPENLLESELFGYERGAFTGAVKRTIGKIEGADGGTLFLDEIGDMPMPLQAKMLRFLQERVIERVGGREVISVDVRIVAATHRDLEAAIAQGTMRQDLFYRIGEVSVRIPPLRERESDAVLIANYLLRRAARRNGRTSLKFSPEAVAAMERHSWPGNVRELENRINAASIMTEGHVVGSADLGLQPAEIDESDSLNLREVRLRAESRAVSRALAISGGNISKAAELLGVTRPTLYDLMQRSIVTPADD
jgi:two-component system NtrC family response regulator